MKPSYFQGWHSGHPLCLRDECVQKDVINQIQVLDCIWAFLAPLDLSGPRDLGVFFDCHLAFIGPLLFDSCSILADLHGSLSPWMWVPGRTSSRSNSPLQTLENLCLSTWHETQRNLSCLDQTGLLICRWAIFLMWGGRSPLEGMLLLRWWS